MPAELQIAFALISTATVVGGFVFAAYQFVAFVRQRRQETALTLMKTTQPPELFSRSVRKIFELPDAAPAEAIHALGPELEQALIETFVKFENLGYLVYSRAIPLHMADDLKNTGKGNLFVVFGEPDITLLPADAGRVRVKVNGVDVFDPSTGEVRSDGADGIACWFVDTDYNEESFFVRHAYFLGANDPYGALKTTLKAEIDEDAWATLHSDTSRPFEKPKSGRIAVKVINHLGDEVMKVFRVV